MSADASPAPPAGPEPRRRFLEVLTGALGAVIGAIVALPGLRFLAHPLGHKTVSGGEEPLRVAAAKDVVPGVPLRADVSGERRDGWLRLAHVKLGACWLVRAEAGGPVRALSTICPHLGCGIDWDAEKKKFNCPCHGSIFAPDGKCTAGPSPRPMDELDIITEGEDLKVRYRRFRLGHAKKETIG